MRDRKAGGWSKGKRAALYLLPLAMAASPLAAQATGQGNDASLAMSKTLRATPAPDAEPLFSEPYIELDEMREGTFPYRFVQGGFKGTDTRFAFSFPMPDQYEGRFFQYLTPVPDSETRSQGVTGPADKVGSAIASGAYFIETNGGGIGAATQTIGQDQSIGAYRANAASAQFSRVIAKQIYGDHRVYGYSYGGSGGAYRTIGGLENTSGVWDGAVPFVMGSPMAIPNMFTVRLHAMRVVGEKLDDVVDALDAGGSGDPYATLTDVEADALREATRMGFPPESWYAWRTMGPHAFALLFGGVRMADPAYFTDFWTKRGYAGHDAPELYVKDREQLSTSIADVITVGEAKAMGLEFDGLPGTGLGTADEAWKGMGYSEPGSVPVAFRLSDMPKSDALMLSDLVLPSGQKLLLSDVDGDIALVGINDPKLIASVKAGDRVTLDNSDILAVQTYHRHQVPTNDQYPVWDQFRDEDGKPLYAQQSMLLGPSFTINAAGTVPTGEYDGKMILLENLWDREALPWQADWYKDRVMEHAGDDTDEKFHLWFTDHALHGDNLEQDDKSRVVSYLGVLQQALRDLSAWVEDGVEPPSATSYRVDDGQIVVPRSAAERGGIQPVVNLSANGGDRAEVAQGASVRLKGTIAVPAGAGYVVSAGWDFDGDGVIDEKATIPVGNHQNVTLSTTHRYAKEGTYFAVLHGTSERKGNRKTDFALIENLARARVVVE